MSPYHFSFGVRVLELVGAGSGLLFMYFFLTGILSGEGFDKGLLVSLLVLAFLLSSPGTFRVDRAKSIGIPAMIGKMLGYTDCPQCGQSVFDPWQEGEYRPESDKGRFLPLKECGNCGHDLSAPLKR
jgi:hypothetical protein